MCRGIKQSFTSSWVSAVCVSHSCDCTEGAVSYILSFALVTSSVVGMTLEYMQFEQVKGPVLCEMKTSVCLFILLLFYYTTQATFITHFLKGEKDKKIKLYVLIIYLFVYRVKWAGSLGWTVFASSEYGLWLLY